MKRLIVAVMFCMAMVSVAYGLDVKDITASAKDKATGIAQEHGKAIADDAAITAEIKLKMSNAASLKDQKIEVSTTGGVVKLTGAVQTKQAKGAATKIAKAVKGVKGVENQINIVKAVKKAKKPV